MTVEEYMSHELASDSDDSTKMHQQKIGQPKRESLHFQGTIRLRFHLLLSFTSPIWEARHRHTQVISFGMPPFQARDKDEPFTTK